MAGHIAEGARAEVEKSAPAERMIDVLAEVPRIVALLTGLVRALEVAHLGGGEPGIPVKTVLHLVGGTLGCRGGGETLRPHGTVRPDMNFLDLAEDAGLENLRAAAQAVEGAALVAHLHADAAVAGGAVEVVEFPQRAHERLLDVDVDAHLHRGNRDRSVHVVGARNRHRVDADSACVVEKLTIVGVEGNLGKIERRAHLLELSLRGRNLLGVGIADRDELGLAGLDHGIPVGKALAHNADGGKADLTVGTAGGCRTAGKSADRGSPGHTLEEPSS